MNDNRPPLSSVLPKLKQKLIEVFDDKLKKIYLYGSYARGDYDEESDVDILLVIDDRIPSQYNKVLSEIAGDFFYESQYLISLIQVGSYEFEIKYPWLPFYSTVKSEGQLVYG